MEPVTDPLLDILSNTPPPAPAEPRGERDLFEVHYWPRTGRVMTVYLGAGTGVLVTDLRIVGTGGRGSGHLADTTMGLAEHLANNSNPQGALAEHTADGAVVYLWEAPSPAQDVTFRLAAGITLPSPALTVTGAGTFTSGGRHATLHRNGTPIGVIIQTDGGRPDFGPLNLDPDGTLTAELIEFAGSCRTDDGLPVTLSELLTALLDEPAREA